MAITRLNHFHARAGEEDALFEALKAVVPLIRDLKGCTRCEIMRDTDKHAHIIILEGWQRIDDHKAALSAIPQETFEPVMALLDEPPYGNYFEG